MNETRYAIDINTGVQLRIDFVRASPGKITDYDTDGSKIARNPPEEQKARLEAHLKKLDQILRKKQSPNPRPFRP